MKRSPANRGKMSEDDWITKRVKQLINNLIMSSEEPAAAEIRQLQEVYPEVIKKLLEDGIDRNGTKL